MFRYLFSRIVSGCNRHLPSQPMCQTELWRLIIFSKNKLNNYRPQLEKFPTEEFEQYLHCLTGAGANTLPRLENTI